MADKVLHMLGVYYGDWLEVFLYDFLTNALTGKILYWNLESFTQIKKEKASGDGCKGEPMDTTSSSVSVLDEEKKPDIKKEPKEEEEGTRSTGVNSSTPSGQSKKKGKSELFDLWLMVNRRYYLHNGAF